MEVAGGSQSLQLLPGQRRGVMCKFSGNQEWENTNYVFTRNDGRPMSPDTITQWLKKFSDRHGLPHVHPHLFRHTHASILIASHVDVVSVSKRLGHSKVSTTEDFYAHALRGADQQASDVFDRMLRGRAVM